MLGLLLGSLSSSRGGSGAGTTSRGVLGSLKHGISLLELEARGARDGDEVLEAVQKSVRSGGSIGDTQSKTELGLDINGLLELSKDRLRSDVEDGGIEDGSVLEDLLDVHLILEGIDLKLIEESGLGSTDLITSPNDLLLSDDFNLGLDNLGLDLEGLEEGGLLGIKTGGSRRNCDITRGNHTSLGGRRSRLSVEDLLDLGEVAIGEDHVGVVVELLRDLLDVVRVLKPDVLQVLIGIITLLGLLEALLKGGSHESLNKN